MRPYEVMVIFDVGAEPPAIQAVVDRLLETVRSNAGTPGHVDRWGRRPFAYEVKHRREGYYIVAEFSGEPQTVAELDRMLSLADEVLRHKVVRLPEKATRRPRARGGPAAYGPVNGRTHGRGGDRRDASGRPGTEPRTEAGPPPVAARPDADAPRADAPRAEAAVAAPAGTPGDEAGGTDGEGDRPAGAGSAG